LLGFHFAPEELFLVYGQKKGRTHHLSCFDIIDLRPHVLEGGDYNQLTLVPVIQQTLSRHHLRGKKTVISFPVKFPWIRVIDVPQMKEREMARIVRLEVERLYLDSTVEKLIDFFTLQETPNENGTMPVLSCAIPRNSVAPYVDLLAAAKLEVVGIDLVEVNVLKLAALQGVNFEEGISLLLNFNMQSTDLMLMERGSLQLVRKVGQGKQQLRELLERTLPADSPARRELGRVDFKLPSEHIPLAGNYVASLLGEIRRSIEFYLTEIKRAEGNVSKVVIAGSGYWPANLAELLALQLHLPLIDMQFDRLPGVEVDYTFAPGFAACGVFAPVISSVLRGNA
jgi:Tfp pilus assembly PilM family ATPase